MAYGPRCGSGGRPPAGAPPVERPRTTGVHGVLWREQQCEDRYARMPAVADGSPGSLTRRIADALDTAIRGGAYGQGERLPEIRSLAGRYRCSQDTVRNALQLVCDRGLTRRVRGLGVFVTGRWPRQR